LMLSEYLSENLESLNLCFHDLADISVSSLDDIETFVVFPLPLTLAASHVSLHPLPTFWLLLRQSLQPINTWFMKTHYCIQIQMTQHHTNGTHVCTLRFAPFFLQGHVTTHKYCIFVFSSAGNILRTTHSYLRYTSEHNKAYKSSIRVQQTHIISLTRNVW